MTVRNIYWVFLGSLCLIFTLPLVQMSLGIFPSNSLNEKRAAFEILKLVPRLKGGDATLAADVNRWFDDRYGFRDVLIRMKNQMDFSVFGTSRRLSLGKDGWMFLRDHDDALVSYERGGDAWRQVIVGKLRSVARFLDQRGVRFVVIGIPDKGEFHAEYKGREVPWRPAATQFDKLDRELFAQRDLIYLDAGQIWRNAAERRDRYWKTDIHHDWSAARLVVTALVRKIAFLEKRQSPSEPRKFVEKQTVIVGDLANILGTLSQSAEPTYFYDNQYIVDQDTAEGHWEKDSRRFEIEDWGPMPLFDFIYKAAPDADGDKLPIMVFFGNSFSDMYFSVGIQTYFKEFYRARNVIPRFNIALSNLPEGTKYVVFQFFAPFFGDEMRQWNPSALLSIDKQRIAPTTE